MNGRFSVHTPFHIGAEVWEARRRDFRLFLHDILGDLDSEPDRDLSEEAADWVDPHTGEVRQLDQLWARLLLTRAREPDYITSSTPLSAAIFRKMLAEANRPMSAVELQRSLGRSNAQTILKVLLTARHHYGIVPLAETAK
jgi:hypothetical protein